MEGVLPGSASRRHAGALLVALLLRARRAVAVARLGAAARVRPPRIDATATITIRLATAADSGVARLAALSERRRVTGPALLAEVDGVPRAALVLDGRQLLADPFAATAELALLLSLRAAQLDAAEDSADGGLPRNVVPLPARAPASQPSPLGSAC